MKSPRDIGPSSSSLLEVLLRLLRSNFGVRRGEGERPVAGDTEAEEGLVRGLGRGMGILADEEEEEEGGKEDDSCE